MESIAKYVDFSLITQIRTTVGLKIWVWQQRELADKDGARPGVFALRVQEQADLCGLHEGRAAAQRASQATIPKFAHPNYPPAWEHRLVVTGVTTLRLALLAKLHRLLSYNR